MMLFKFDIKYVRLNFKTIASMKFSFDLYLILTWSRNYVSFKWNVKKTVTRKIWKNSVSRVSINQISPSIDRMRWKPPRKFHHMIQLIKIYFGLIECSFSIDRLAIESRSNWTEPMWWFSLYFWLIENSFRSIKCSFSVDRVAIEYQSS